MKYDHKQVEKKWQDIWDEKQCFHAENDSDKEKFYALVEFPYPSGQAVCCTGVQPHDVPLEREHLQLIPA